MNYYEVAPNQIIRQHAWVFTYASNQPLEIGSIVTIEVGRKQHVGVVMKKVAKPTYETKPILAVIEKTPLPTALLSLAEWLSSYYGTHFAIVLQSILPSGITKQRRGRSKKATTAIRERTNFVLNEWQRSATQRITTKTSGTLLLHGVTGSGKTAVYIEAAKKVLALQRSVIVLVPEIALTSQLVDEFSHHFDNVILTHSRQTEAERHIAWKHALNTLEPTVVIGPRSALFMPIRRLGLILIDEAHEPSFKQEQAPRYSALRAASMLVKSHRATLVLGTATPLVSDYYLAQTQSDALIELPERAVKGAVAPKIELIDMTKRENFKAHRFLSDALIHSIQESLDNNGQVLVFHNRRGSASTTLCEQCGWSASCPRCYLPLTLHADTHLLQCHTCGHTEPVPTSCPVCQSTDIIHKGIGTKLIETEIRKLFPQQHIARFDGDAQLGDSVEDRYKDLYDGTINIIIGTQVIAKGLDLPRLRTVGVIQADAGLALPDFASTERTFQLLAQVIGRVGRSTHKTRVVVQSFQPKHYAITNGLHQDYQAFYTEALKERRRASFPPFMYLLRLTCSYKTEVAAIRQSQHLAKILKHHAPNSVEILGPTPSFYERLRGNYRWQLTLKSPRRSDLTQLLEYIPPTHWQFELDPTSLLS